MTKRQTHTNEDLERMDNEQAARNSRQSRLSVINQKLEAVGLDLDELIELIKARQEGIY